MKKKKQNGQQFKSEMNKQSKIKKVVHTQANINDSWESPDYGRRYVPGEHFNNWIDNRL
jgi:hypothetical protein